MMIREAPRKVRSFRAILIVAFVLAAVSFMFSINTSIRRGKLHEIRNSMIANRMYVSGELTVPSDNDFRALFADDTDILADHSTWFASHDSVEDIYVVMMAMGSNESDVLASTAIKSILHSYDFESSITFIIVRNDIGRPFPLNVSSDCVKIISRIMGTDRYEQFTKLTGFKTHHYSEKSTMSKLFVTKVIPDVKRFLVIDTDTIVFSNIRTLWNAALELRTPMASVCMVDSLRVKSYCGNPEHVKFCHPTHYCSGGVMFYRFDLNSEVATLNWWVEMAKVLVAEGQKVNRYFAVAEQDLINYVAATKTAVIGFLPCEWNCDFNSHRYNQINQERCPQKVCSLVHFLGGNWKKNKNEFTFYRYFWDAFQSLPQGILNRNCSRVG